MKRALDAFLGALAAAVAVAAIVREDRRRPVAGAPPETAAAPAPPSTTIRGGFVASPTSADLPRAVPAGGMARVAAIGKALAARIKLHQTTLLGAGLAYYAFFTIFPISIAAASIYGLIADPQEVKRVLADLTDVLPESTAMFVESNVLRVFESGRTSLGVATAVSTIVALWSASAGAKALITAIDLAYGEEETRSFFLLRGVALATTLGIILFGLTSAAAATTLPHLLSGLGLESETVNLLSILRWPVILIVVFLGLGALYKLAPNRPRQRTPWLNLGAAFAAVTWSVVTLGFSIYVTEIADFGAVYGTLASLASLMLWFFISAVIVLVGAELNDELEQRSVYARPEPTG